MVILASTAYTPVALELEAWLISSGSPVTSLPAPSNITLPEPGDRLMAGLIRLP